MSEKKRIWYCKIGEIDAWKVPGGGDFPMREAVRKAYYELTGEYPDFMFSGWGAELDEIERLVVNQSNKVPPE